jgi:hypothetical protein
MQIIFGSSAHGILCVVLKPSEYVTGNEYNGGNGDGKFRGDRCTSGNVTNSAYDGKGNKDMETKPSGKFMDDLILMIA